MWEELIDVLGKLSSAYDGLTKIGERKRDALIAIDMKGLAKILDEEQLAAAKIEKLERQRGAVLRKLTENIPPDELTKAADLYKRAPTKDIENRLTELHKALVKNVDNALKLRNHTQILAQGALDAVKYHLNRLSGAAVQPTYGSRGGDIVTHRKKLDYQA